jgi:urease accessory protein
MRHASKLAAALALLLPALAHAHPGHAPDATFAAGALHPLTGVDHLLLLAFAGWLAARLGAATLRVLGAVFVVVLTATASAHLGANASADPGAAGFAAGLLVTSVGVIFLAGAATAAAGKLLLRRPTAASRR